ncbi:PspC domain-containing protein [Eubacterium sp. 1001713B170207_170306_E7]|uniref:PspC domain-containing protein n=1 Tax=Eubacterium sp. 1001713B170207_170306_E7 TaxID=2787097 RepID=UPI001897F4FE|nr:PspC domain-containing protein [Eubacterium sp. 1001713B170207_170306_E7]
MRNQKKRLLRDKRNGIISGVCQGIGEYLGVSPWIFRVLFILPVLPFVLNFISGVISILVYVVLSAVIKDKGSSAAQDDNVVEVEYEIVDDEDDQKKSDS